MLSGNTNLAPSKESTSQATQFTKYLLDRKLSWLFRVRWRARAAPVKQLMRTLHNTERHIARPKAFWRSTNYLFGSMHMSHALRYGEAVAK